MDKKLKVLYAKYEHLMYLYDGKNTDWSKMRRESYFLLCEIKREIEHLRNSQNMLYYNFVLQRLKTTVEIEYEHICDRSENSQLN